MFKRGTHIFSMATIYLFIIAFFHTLGISNQPIDPEGIALLESMKAYTIDMFVMETNFYNIQTSLGLTMTIFLVLLALLNWTIAASGAYLIRKIALINALFMWGLVGLYYYFNIPPPLFAFLVAALLFSLAFLTTRRQPRT